jgi:predicted ribosome quality control (RQC) complex YloA/Tae2 family protein
MKEQTIYVEENDKEYIILIGKNKHENVDIIKQSSLNDLWFHLDNISGPHIVMQSNGDKIPKRYLNFVARLFSQHKNNLPSRYNVIYTEIGNVKLTDIPGSVVTSKTKTIKM